MSHYFSELHHHLQVVESLDQQLAIGLAPHHPPQATLPDLRQLCVMCVLSPFFDLLGREPFLFHKQLQIEHEALGLEDILGDWPSGVELLYLQLFLKAFSPPSEGPMPPLRVDFPKNYMSPCFPLQFVRHFELELVESPTHNLDVPLAKQRVNVPSRPPLEHRGGEDFRLCERDYVLQRVVQYFCAHEVLEVGDHDSHGVVDILLELEDLPDLELQPEGLPLFELCPLAAEPLRDFGPQEPLLEVPLLMHDGKHVFRLPREGLFHVPVVSSELPGVEQLLLPHFNEVVKAILYVLILDIHFLCRYGTGSLLVLSGHHRSLCHDVFDELLFPNADCLSEPASVYLLVVLADNLFDQKVPPVAFGSLPDRHKAHIVEGTLEDFEDEGVEAGLELGYPSPTLKDCSLLGLHRQVHVLRDKNVDRLPDFRRVDVDLARCQLLQKALRRFGLQRRERSFAHLVHAPHENLGPLLLQLLVVEDQLGLLPNLYLCCPYLSAALVLTLSCGVLAEGGNRSVEGLLLSVLHQPEQRAVLL